MLKDIEKEIQDKAKKVNEICGTLEKSDMAYLLRNQGV